MKKLIQKIKHYLKTTFIGAYFYKTKWLYKKEFGFSNKKTSRLFIFFCFLRTLFKIKIVTTREKDEFLREAILFKKSCRKLRISILPNSSFVYDIDPFILKVNSSSYFKQLIGNITVNYQKVISKGFLEIKKEIQKSLSEQRLNAEEEKFLKGMLIIIEGIEILQRRYLESLRKYSFKNKKIQNLIKIFQKIPLIPPTDLKSALQFYLFINSLVWLESNSLVGLGRLDQIFYPYFLADIKKGKITIKETYSLFKEFFILLHKDYQYKSNVLLGDTGQVIILGGKNKDGTDATNELTYIIIDTLKDLNIPNHKIVLRVHNNTNKKLWDKSMDCLISGLQSPLFSNDDTIIPALIEFGYKSEDAFDYGTSACWEPLILGKSLDQNNIDNIIFLQPLTKIINNTEPQDFEEFFSMYKKELKKMLSRKIKDLNKIKFAFSPFLSLLVDDCLEKRCDISCGGARYNNYGLLSVSIGNAVNSLLNIEKIVFKEKKYSLKELLTIIKNNFYDNEKIREELKNKGLKFGMDDSKVIYITNEIINCVYGAFRKKHNKLGGRFKFGLSSPAFIDLAKEFPPSLDGRKRGENFGVHISPVMGTQEIGFTEIANFASRIDYKKAFNGAVLDVILERKFLLENKKKIIDYIKTYFRLGGFQLQCNVLDLKTLILAKNNPDQFPNLIVRVWGFCTYFKDLPSEYQDLIIKRANYYESISYKNSEI